MAIGHFMMAFETLFLGALLMLILGIGAFKPNISTQVGALYAPGDDRRDRAYSIFYLGINIGAFLAPLVCGTLAVQYGWHAGFGAAGVGMLVGLGIYLGGQRTLPPDAVAAGKDARRRKETARPRRAPRRAHADRGLRIGDDVLGGLRSAGQHAPAVGRGFHRPLGRSPGLARRGSVDLVPRLEPAHDLHLHAADRAAVGAARPARHRAVSPISKMAFGCLCVASPIW